MKTEKYQRQPWEWSDDEVIMACMDYTTRSAILRNNRSAYICIAYRNLWNQLTWLRDRCSERSHKMDDNETEALSGEIANKIQNEMTYPGQVKITVIRETRSVAYAK